MVSELNKIIKLLLSFALVFSTYSYANSGSLLQANSDKTIDGHPVLLLPKSNRYIYLTQNSEQGVFDSPSAHSQYTDDYRYFPFALNFDSQITLTIRSLAQKDSEVTFFEGKAKQGLHYFSLSYSFLNKLLGKDTAFEIYLKVDVDDKNDVTDTAVWQGSIERSYRGEMLGNVIHLETFIRTGGITLRREDVKISHYGPNLQFIRSYRNHSLENPLRATMGHGWQHNNDIQISIVKTGLAKTENNVPRWVTKSLGTVLPISQLPLEYQKPTLVIVTNGGFFQRKGDGWEVQRSFHGRMHTVVDNENQFVFTAKDASKYFFDDFDNKIKRPSIFKKDLTFTPKTNEANIITDKSDSHFLSPIFAFSGPSPLLLQRVEDKNGVAMKYNYAPSVFGDVLSSVEDSIGREFEFSYNVAYEDMQVTGTALKPIRLTKVTGPDDIILKFTFDDTHFEQVLFERADFNEAYGYTQLAESFLDINNKYFSADRSINKLTDGLGNVKRYFFAKPEKVETLSRYLPAIPIHKVVDRIRFPDMSLSKFTYGPNANERGIINFNGYKTNYVINEFGNPQKTMYQNGNIEERVWSVDVGLSDDVTLTKKNNAGITRYEYDPMGNVTKETYPNGRVKTTLWDLNTSEPLEIVYANGDVETFKYSPKGNLISHVDGDYKVLYEYDDFGRKILQKNKDVTRTYTYDKYGYINAYFDNDVLQYTYVNDVRGLLLSKTSREGIVEEYTYDSVDRLLQTKRQGKVIEEKKYDAKGNVIFHREGDGPEIFYTYNERGVVSKIKYSSGETDYYRYDSTSNLTERVDTYGDVILKKYHKDDTEIVDEKYPSWDRGPIF